LAGVRADGIAAHCDSWLDQPMMLADAVSLNKDGLPILAQTAGFGAAERPVR
jgi:hypothetical protein